jgi:hypothetical protein
MLEVASTDISRDKELMCHSEPPTKSREKFRIEQALKDQIDQYAKAQGFESQAVVARAINYAHPKLCSDSGDVIAYEHLRRAKVLTFKTTVITPNLSEHTLNQIEEVRVFRGMKPVAVVIESLRLFFKDLERQAVGTLDKSALTHFSAPSYHLADVKFAAPWIEAAPTTLPVQKEKRAQIDLMADRVIYVGADFFLTLMTRLECKYRPGYQGLSNTEYILKMVSKSKFNLVTSTGEFHRLFGLGAAILEARDEVHLKELVQNFNGGRSMASSGAFRMVERMALLPRLGVRIVPAGVENYAGAGRFMQAGAGENTSLTTLLGLTTMRQLIPGESIGMLRFLSDNKKPFMPVWQDFAPDGRLEYMSSLD